MSESRLSSLSLMKINRDRCNELTAPSKIQTLVTEFAKANPKRIKLPFMLADHEHCFQTY